jgi:hypothetical protein
MSTTTNSPKAVVRAALSVAAETLPPHTHRFSPKKFTQHQLFVCLVLKTFFGTDYRGIVIYLKDMPDLAASFSLKVVPHYTTLQKASQRLLRNEQARMLLDASITEVLQGRKTVELAAVDSTGLESGHVSSYFVKRCNDDKRHQKTPWPKLAIIVDVITHGIIAVLPTKGPGRDATHFKDILKLLPKGLHIEHLLADAGYDSEANHVFANEDLGTRTTIPPTSARQTDNLPRGRYRREMKLQFDREAYVQRWQVETVMSMIKRNLSDCLYARKKSSQQSEMILLTITHNLTIFWLIIEVFYRA